MKRALSIARSCAGRISEAVYKLSPRHMVRNPVMFVVLVGSVLDDADPGARHLAGRGDWGFTFRLRSGSGSPCSSPTSPRPWPRAREGAGRCAARQRQETRAKRLRDPSYHLDFLSVFANELRSGDHVIVKAGDLIPADGEVVEGVASVDESAITGESRR